ncbi:MAG: hypothetical protein AAB969_00125 [Patescibacteria group bacterium]
MPLNLPSLILLSSSFLLGLRHGIDWDHIAAISDISGSCESRRQGIIFGSVYALGHATVIIVLGLLSVLIGINLPGWVDRVMKPIVGLTLILLSLWLLVSIYLHGRNFKMKSRWMMLFSLLQRFYIFFHNKVSHHHKKEIVYYDYPYGLRLAYLIGMIHGIGVETPSQVLLFVTAAGIGGGFTGAIFVAVFVLGLLISNSVITIIISYGYLSTKTNSNLRLIIGTLTAIFSLYIGILFLFGKVYFLSALLGG